MHIIIIDATGSVSEEQLNAGTEFYCEILNRECPFESREPCSVFVWSNLDGLRLQTVVAGYRAMDPHCVIHFITDGFVQEDEVSHIDHLYIYRDTAHTMLHTAKRRVTGLVPVPYQSMEDEPIIDVEPKAPHEDPPVLLDPMQELRETVQEAEAILKDPVNYKANRERLYELFPMLKELEDQFQAFDQRMQDDKKKWAEENPKQAKCNHGVTFDEKEGASMTAPAVRKKWPRLMGLCPKGCGYNGIAYASYAHYICGDW